MARRSKPGLMRRHEMAWVAAVVRRDGVTRCHGFSVAFTAHDDSGRVMEIGICCEWTGRAKAKIE